MKPDYYSNVIRSLIKEEIDKLILPLEEIFDTKTKTNYKIIGATANDYATTIYRFSTLSGISYDLEFFSNAVDRSMKMNDQFSLGDYVALKDKFIPYNDIGFTTTDTRSKHNDDVDDDGEYEKNTNNNEAIEVLSRISYLVTEFMSNNPNNMIYVVGRNTDPIKLMSYKAMFNNIFKNDYSMIEGHSTGYTKGALYFINKSILTIP